MLDITKTKIVYQWKYDSPLIACRISPSGKEAVSTSEDSVIIRWKIESGEKVPMLGHESWVHAIAYAPDGKLLVSGGCEGKLIWWDMINDVPATVRKVDAHLGWIRAVEVSPDGKRIVSVGNDKYIRVWDLASGEMITEITNAHDRHIYSAHFHSSLPLLMTGDLLGKIHVWNLETFQRERVIEATPLYTENKGQQAEFGGIRSLAYHAGRSELIAGGTHKATNPFGAVHEPLVLRIGWEDGTLKKSHACEGIPGGMIWRVQWLPDGIAVGVSGGSTGGILLFFNDSQEKEIHRFKLPSLARDMDLHAPSGLIATAHFDRHLRFTSIAAT